MVDGGIQGKWAYLEIGAAASLLLKPALRVRLVVLTPLYGDVTRK
jgi:hypothetical protein